MHFVKSIMTALVLVSFLPWCGISVASAATANVESDAQVLNETVLESEAGATDATFTAPSKKKRLAVFQQVRCSADAPVLSGIDQFLSVPKNVQTVFSNPRLIQRCAQAPPTSPPRSV